MSARMKVALSLEEHVKTFLDAEGCDLRIVTEGEAPVVLDDPGERLECRLELLRKGGWITCSTARAMAERLGIEKRVMGRLMDHLDVKIRDCELECFE